MMCAAPSSRNRRHFAPNSNQSDQRAAKADVALIVSHALPKGLQTFDQIDGVWVTEPRCAVAVAIALREALIALSAAQLAGEGQQTKMELVYQYLTGPRFILRWFLFEGVRRPGMSAFEIRNGLVLSAARPSAVEPASHVAMHATQR